MESLDEDLLERKPEVLFCGFFSFQYCREMLSEVAATLLSLADTGYLITLQHRTKTSSWVFPAW